MRAIESEHYISDLSASLHILRGDKESEDTWVFRVLYSAIGLNMLASLYDFGDIAEDEPTVSMQHVLQRGTQLIHHFQELFPSLSLLQIGREAMEKQIVDCYQKTGFMLHKLYRFAAPQMSLAYDRGLSFPRGLPPWEANNISGLGPFISEGDPTAQSIWAMFCIDDQPIQEWWSSFLNMLHWQADIPPLTDIEYINLNRKAQENYWLPSIRPTELSMCRVAEKTISQSYFLIRAKEGKRERATLPAWACEKGNYIRISLALMQSENRKRVVSLQNDGHITHIKLDYRLPPREQNVLELHSWPTKESSSWERTVVSSLVPLFSHLFTNLGFMIQEVA